MRALRAFTGLYELSRMEALISAYPESGLGPQCGKAKVVRPGKGATPTFEDRTYAAEREKQYCSFGAMRR